MANESTYDQFTQEGGNDEQWREILAELDEAVNDETDWDS